MPRLWAVINVTNYLRIGGLFSGVISLIMAIAAVFGFVILVYAAILLIPFWIVLLFSLLIGVGIAIAVVGIVQNAHRSDDTAVSVEGGNKTDYRS